MMFSQLSRCMVLTLLLAAAACAPKTPPNVTGAAVGLPKTGAYKVGKPYQVKGVWYYPKEDYAYDETGIASWYGPGFHQKATANGEKFDTNDLTAAHKTLPMPSLVRVTNLENGRSIVVRINDRGPFVPGRIIDLSRRSAQLLGVEQKGTAKVRVTILPDESRAIAVAAQSGTSSSDMPELIPVVAAAPVTPVEIEGQPLPMPKPERQTQLAIDLPGQTVEGRFLPAPVVEEVTVKAASQMWVQAGAFTVYDNAKQLRDRLSRLGPAVIAPLKSGGAQYFRVRVGPFETVEQADAVLGRVQESGVNGAKVIVE